MSLPSNAVQPAEADELLFAEDLPQDDHEPGQVWRVLIVDDEPDVHRATTFALSDVIIMGRTLEFLHAYTSEQAVSVLRQEAGIAVILLDVVMESEHAGLELVKTIRQSLKLADVRIILRTGQPGSAS